MLFLMQAGPGWFSVLKDGRTLGNVRQDGDFWRAWVLGGRELPQLYAAPDKAAAALAPKRGRPVSPKGLVSVVFRYDSDKSTRLKALAASTRIQQSELLREAIADVLKKYETGPEMVP